MKTLKTKKLINLLKKKENIKALEVIWACLNPSNKEDLRLLDELRPLYITRKERNGIESEILKVVKSPAKSLKGMVQRITDVIMIIAENHLNQAFSLTAKYKKSEKQITINISLID